MMAKGKVVIQADGTKMGMRFTYSADGWTDAHYVGETLTRVLGGVGQCVLETLACAIVSGRDESLLEDFPSVGNECDTLIDAASRYVEALKTARGIK